MNDAAVHLTSVASGDGIPLLRERLAAAVAAQDAARRRLSADIVDCAGRLRRGVADREPSITADADDALIDALARTAGVPHVLEAVTEDYRREAASSGGWVFTRWLRSFRPDPLARLRLDRSLVPLDSAGRDSVRAVLGRSSIPPASPAAQAAVSLATRQLAARATEGMPVRWAEAIEDAAAPGVGLADALDQAVVHTPLRDGRPAWWQAMSLLQWVFGLAVVVGALWLVVLAVVGWLQLPAIPTPTVGVLPVPTLLLGAGLVLGALTALMTRWLAAVGARRRRSVVGARLRDAVTAVAHQRIVEPVAVVLERHRLTRERLDAARGAGH